MHILIGLVIALVLVAVLSNRKTRNCRWRADRSRNVDDQHFHICMSCGATCLTQSPKSPQECLKKP
ncbi:hypothetical protein FAP39_00780 [Shimia litoralis]|uniref:Uncharacterized protein n=1 Tax=Shimia litoralis TaxID=420403 RepID=A0A4U7N8Y7_9RHOB|nr:hypothetical protein FAP39_00780 [Shimia litoralis]